MKVKLSLWALAICTSSFLFAQEENVKMDPVDSLGKEVIHLQDKFEVLNRLKLTGYIQPQFQLIDSAGAASFAGGNFPANTNSRFTMRRGRIKFTYEHGNAMYMLNTDWTEKGVNIRETYVKITDPWVKWFALSMGMRQIQFGFDISFSSGDRETPERARMFQILFPTERDMQALVTIQAPKTSRLNFLKLDLAVLNGSGVAAEFDSNKDYSGRLSITKATKSEKVKIGAGISYLTGGYRHNRKTVYDFETATNGDHVFVAHSDTSNYNSVAKREYMGADIQITSDLPIGINIIRAEYIQGKQPGTSSSSTSPSVAPTSDIYHREFNGASFYFIQNIGRSKHQFLAKYDWYDPNVKVAGDEIGKSGSNTKSADIKYTTIGLGWLYRFDSNTKIVLYYDMVTNEKTVLKGYTKDIPDNVITCRLQYKF